MSLVFYSAYHHVNSAPTCDECGHDDTPPQRHRLGQGNPEPAVHPGRLASGNSVCKSAEDGDMMAKKEGILGMQSEGAGGWDRFPCLGIKGARDYADVRKTKEWQP